MHSKTLSTSFGIVCGLGASLIGAAPVAAQQLADFFPETGHMFASDAMTSDSFGSAVSLDGDRLCVGAAMDYTSGGSEAGSVYVFERSGSGSWTQVAHLYASDGFVSHHFGASVALDGNRLCVGAAGSSAPGTPNCGSVYVFERSGAGAWTQVAHLYASDVASYAAFGHSVSLEGDRLCVGSRYDSTAAGAYAGSVYVFERSGSGSWSEVAHLYASDGAAWDLLGTSVSLDGDRLGVGAGSDDTLVGTDAGSVYVFERSVAGVWSEVAHLYASDGAAGDEFGSTVSLEGDRLCGGVSYDSNPGGFAAGSAYVFERNAVGIWTQAAHLFASNGTALDYFGASVSLEGDRLCVGAYRADNLAGGAETGSAFVFERSGSGAWMEVAHISASDGDAGDWFGGAVSLDGDRLCVGAWKDNSASSSAVGSVYAFDMNSVINLDNPGWASADLIGEILRANNGDRLALRTRALADSPDILDASTKRLTYVAIEPLTIPANVMMTVGDLSVFADAPGLPNGGPYVMGELIAPRDGTVTFQQLAVGEGGAVVQNGAILLINDDLNSVGDGTCYLDGQILAESVLTAPGGENRVAANTDVFGNYTNQGATIIQRGILYIYGTLINTGVLTGDYNNGLVPPEPGDGYAIGGDYVVGAGGSVILSNPVWWLRVGGNVDIAINDPSRFVMSEATLEMTALSKSTAQTLEVMSADLGENESGFAVNNFPLGALVIRAGSITTLVDARDNASGVGPEVMYIDTLIVPVGATLVTGGKAIYAHSTSIQGTVSNPADIIIVVACDGDIDGDGIVGAADLTHILTNWGGNGQGFFDADINDDQIVDGLDLGIVMGSWGACAN